MSDSSATYISYKPSGWTNQQTLDQHALLCTVWPQYLTLQEACDIIDQFNCKIWAKDQQVLWSGVNKAKVQKTANENGMQTLQTAMGPLMDPNHPTCLRPKKSPEAWSTYIKGASLIFAWRISQGEVATIITPPPPDCFHPSQMTSLQDIEIPVLRGCLGNRPVSRIDLWHPTVKGAESFRYPIWPDDHTSSWYETFEPQGPKRQTWRLVSKHRVLLLLVMVLRMAIRILVPDETDLHAAKKLRNQAISSDLGSKTKVTDETVSPGTNRSIEIQNLEVAKVKQLPMRLATVDAASMPDLVDAPTRNSHTIFDKTHTPLMVPVESLTAAEGSGSFSKRSKTAARKLRKLLKQREESEAKGNEQKSFTATS
ncbi:formamidopyrimidine-DNA glycosylase [Colletotrichum tofieldiae]|uniref:Formamidopyrimidine-DNA glycosylase n=1 Tax=Colletotrichum tofieldiae TaxID=708197 RepID=A0A161WKL8_9PEZI|nr:formamidopyrimidine-DNA glycosylase [Colletotrichum tofieldiae]